MSSSVASHQQASLNGFLQEKIKGSSRQISKVDLQLAAMKFKARVASPQTPSPLSWMVLFQPTFLGGC